MNGKGYLLPLFIVLVFIATIALQIYTPATRGYFNLGETAIYTIAALSTPLASGIAAGIGSALADLVTGYWYFAPGTLVIKFVEGYVASYAMRRLRKSPIWFNKALSISIGTIVGALLGIIAWLALSGIPEVSSFPLSIIVWIVPVAISIAIVTYLTTRWRRGHAYLAASMVLGGLCMVLGYFLYEYFFSNPVILNLPPEGAFAEIPVNLMQMIAGVAFGVPTANFVLEALGVEDKG